MSIRPHILSLEGSNRLWRYSPPGRHPARRRLFLAAEAWRDLTDPNSFINRLALRGVVEAELTRWVHGGTVWVDLEGKPRLLKKLRPSTREIWEVLFTHPAVQARLFCRFAEPDTLIGTKFHTRGLLGRKGSANWKDALQACEKAWKDLFPAHPPFSGKTIHDYVTENCDDYPICG